MKHFLIKYRLANAPADSWHRDVTQFIAAIDSDPALQGKIAYRSMKSRDGDYYHLATAADEAAVKALQQSAFFSRYTDKIKQAAAGGKVDVVPLEIVAETKSKA
jgi:hypothetical protein